jgi:hypothetical protein
MPYDPGYEEAGWRNDLTEAKWALIPVPPAVLALLGVIAVYHAHTDLGSGGLRGHSGIDGRTAYGGLATLLTLILSLGGVAIGVTVARTTSHRVRRLAIAGAASSTIVFGIFVGFAVATA